MKCDICQKHGALNFYGIAITDKGTFITHAKWGANITQAKNRAILDAQAFVWDDDFLYDIKLILAHNAKEVKDAYEV